MAGDAGKHPLHTHRKEAKYTLLSRVRGLWFTGQRSESYRRTHAKNLPNTVSRTAKFILKKTHLRLSFRKDFAYFTADRKGITLYIRISYIH